MGFWNVVRDEQPGGLVRMQFPLALYRTSRHPPVADLVPDKQAYWLCMLGVDEHPVCIRLLEVLPVWIRDAGYPSEPGRGVWPNVGNGRCAVRSAQAASKANSRSRADILKNRAAYGVGNRVIRHPQNGNCGGT